MIDTISIHNNCLVSMEITFTPKIAFICPIGGAPVSGELQVTYIPNERLLEFEGFEKYLISVSQDKATAEQFAEQIYKLLLDTLVPRSLKVVLSVSTQTHASALISILSP